jgi:hypothetical protein
MCLPAAQLGQKAWPDSAWCVLGEQLVHAFVFSSLEYLPGVHTLQRESSKLVLSFSYLPGVHCSFIAQKGCPTFTWYLPPGHVLQFPTLTMLEYLVAGQSRHDRSEVLFGSRKTRLPAAHFL